MNIFLPYPEDIPKSVAALDDRRLIKQILECKQIITMLETDRKAYANHPVVQHYKAYQPFLARYGAQCVSEYIHRFAKDHKYFEFFFERMPKGDPKFVPFYAEGKKTDIKCIRTTDHVGELFRQKLCKKWTADLICPKWTNRQIPDFYQEYLEKECNK